MQYVPTDPTVLAGGPVTRHESTQLDRAGEALSMAIESAGIGAPQ
jgi:hypothetical protein